MQNILIVVVIVEGVVLLLNVMATLALIQYLSRSAHPRAIGLTKGSTAPDIDVSTLDGEVTKLSRYIDGVTAVVFVSPTCGPCRTAMRQIGEHLVGRGEVGAVRTVLVSTADVGATRGLAWEFDVDAPVVSMAEASEASKRQYRLTSTPSFCLIDGDRRVISSGAAVDTDENWTSLLTTGWDERQHAEVGAA